MFDTNLSLHHHLIHVQNWRYLTEFQCCFICFVCLLVCFICVNTQKNAQTLNSVTFIQAFFLHAQFFFETFDIQSQRKKNKKNKKQTNTTNIHILK